jgi:NAD(P)H-dependent flavin oxidoreductase YrpB (nitropropane dioxygenase family)
MAGLNQQHLKLELPIIHAPMAGVQGSSLAIAVSNAAGLGDFSSLWAGQNTSGCRQIGAAELTRDLTRNLARNLSR